MWLVMFSVCSSAVHYSSFLSRGNLLDHVIGPAGILATKARILVTNTVSFLKQHDQLVFLRRGIILESGTYQDILADESKELHKLLYDVSCF